MLEREACPWQARECMRTCEQRLVRLDHRATCHGGHRLPVEFNALRQIVNDERCHKYPTQQIQGRTTTHGPPRFEAGETFDSV